jgi:hypothetical protein
MKDKCFSQARNFFQSLWIRNKTKTQFVNCFDLPNRMIIQTFLFFLTAVPKSHVSGLRNAVMDTRQGQCSDCVIALHTRLWAEMNCVEPNVGSYSEDTDSIPDSNLILTVRGSLSHSQILCETFIETVNGLPVICKEIIPFCTVVDDRPN